MFDFLFAISVSVDVSYIIFEIDIGLGGRNDLEISFSHQKWHQSKAIVYDFLLVVYSNFCRITYRF